MQHWYRQAYGNVCVLLHGFTGTERAWDDVVHHLPDGPGVVALALPGHHPDVQPQRSFEASCDGLAATIRRLGARSIHLAGYSLGARLALGLTVRHPALVDCLSLVGGHIGLEEPTARQVRQTQDALWVDILEQQGIEAFVSAWERQPIFVSQVKLSDVKRRLQRQARLRHDPNALAASLRSTGLGVMPNYWPALATMRPSLHFIAGGEDQKFVHLVRRAQACAPHASLDIIEGCGHNPLAEAPAALAQLLGRAWVPR